MVRSTFSPARAWRLTVGPASTRTLGRTQAVPSQPQRCIKQGPARAPSRRLQARARLPAAPKPTSWSGAETLRAKNGATSPRLPATAALTSCGVRGNQRSLARAEDWRRLCKPCAHSCVGIKSFRSGAEQRQGTHFKAGQRQPVELQARTGKYRRQSNQNKSVLASRAGFHPGQCGLTPRSS